jgi:Fe-S-cluster-containing dehydrogenase component/DMSO reductase anchor subunit
MNRGFIFDINKCVNCSACSAACVLENGWTVHARAIYTHNSEAVITLPVINVSLACNHCEKPVCLEGCPAGSYYRESNTGAIVIDEKKCFGCKYCQWNCPYDAPKLETVKGTIVKCNLCFSRLMEGLMPACVNACPTGALQFGEFSKTTTENRLSWVPDKKLNPSLQFIGQSDKPLHIIPEDKFSKEEPYDKVRKASGKPEWSLLIFSFLCTLSVGLSGASLIKGVFPNLFISLSTIFVAGASSLFHLGRMTRAWRAASNLKTSPLSREIAMFLIYSATSSFAIVFELPAFLIVSSVAGFLLLLAIDAVYTYAENRKSIFYHSGQTFISALLITSFFTGSIVPFLFIAMIKFVSSTHSMYVCRSSANGFGIRFFRLAFLLITAAAMISGLHRSENIIIVLFLTGELFDRIIFYADFVPLNIKILINNHI